MVTAILLYSFSFFVLITQLVTNAQCSPDLLKATFKNYLFYVGILRGVEQN